MNINHTHNNMSFFNYQPEEQFKETSEKPQFGVGDPAPTDDPYNEGESAIAISTLVPNGIQLTTIDLMPSKPPLAMSTPFKQGNHFQKLVYKHQKSSHPLSNPYRLALIDYIFTYRNNIEYIPERMDVAFVRICMLKYLGRYVVKWRNFSEDLFSINRENNKDCVRVYGGFRSVWGKWKKQYKHQNFNHPEFIQAILENAKRIFEKEINSDLNGIGKVV